MPRLTRLHQLHLYELVNESNQYGPLAALGGTLQSLCIEGAHSLPDCLPRMMALRTLVSRGSTSARAAKQAASCDCRQNRMWAGAGRLGLPCASSRWRLLPLDLDLKHLLLQVFIDTQSYLSGAQGEHSIGTFSATLRQLPNLQQLAVQLADHVDSPAAPPMALVPGPWQGTLRQLAANADLLLASLPALGAATQLQELGIGSATDGEQEPAALGVLRWVSDQPQLPLRRLALQLFGWTVMPSPALFDACMVLQNHRPALTIQLASTERIRRKSCAELLTV